MTCLIADDNEIALMMLSSLVAQVNELEEVAQFSSAVEAYAYLKNNEVDIAFLDVEMPGMTAIELIKALPKKPVVVLSTANPKYAVDAYELNVADYLVKPVSLARFLQAVEKAGALLDRTKPESKKNDTPYLFIKEKSVLHKVMFNNILYVEAMGDYIKVHCADKWYTVNTTLRSFEEKYDANFVRVHRSYLVSFDKIERIDEGTVYVHEHKIPLTESYRKNLLEKLNMI